MPVIHHDPSALEPAYGISCRRVLGQNGYTTPFGAHQCVVPPGGQSAPHQHHEGEVFFIARGTGTIRIGSEPETHLAPGDVVMIPPHTTHVLKNKSKKEELVFTSVWFASSGSDLPDPPSLSILMAAPPTPNGGLHLGHLSGPYLALDAMARIRRQDGSEVRTAAGSDDHQTYVVTSSQHRGESPTATSDHFGLSIQNTLEWMRMKPESWLRPVHDRAYQERVQAVVRDMLSSGVLQAVETPTLFNEQGECLVEAFVTGGCPHCGATTSGNGCEACFVPNICSDLVDPRCARTGQKAVTKMVTRLVFKMEPFLGKIRHWVAHLDRPEWLERLSEKVLWYPFPTPEFPVSHPGHWGIEVPGGLPCAGQRLFAWFEMAVGFFHMEPRLADPDRELLFAFGSDNAWYYLTLLPAVMLAVEPGCKLPQALLTNRFLLLDGSKFSTSRRHAIWGDEALEHLSADFIRLCLAAARPESEETDFSLSHMKQVMRSMVEPWQVWWETLAIRLEGQKRCIPFQRPAWEEFDQGIYRELGQLWRSAQKHRQPASFSLRGQLEAAHEAARLGSLLAVGNAPLELACLAVGVFARLVEPIMPEAAAGLAQAVGLPLVSDGTLSLPRPGQPLGDLTRIAVGTMSQVTALAESRKVPA